MGTKLNTMNKLFKKIEEFNVAYGVDYNNKPRLVDKETYDLRKSLGQEELDEYYEACESGNLEGIADALGDQLYILLGTMCAHGLQNKMQKIFNEIHKSNMSKLDPKTGKPIRREDGKIIKGSNYKAPNLGKILNPKRGRPKKQKKEVATSVA